VLTSSRAPSGDQSSFSLAPFTAAAPRQFSRSRGRRCGAPSTLTGFERIETGQLVDTYARSKFEDTRAKAAKFGARGTTLKAYKRL
jgi:hypothetical protein